MTDLHLTIPREWWLTSNQRLHWAVKAKRTKWVRETAQLAARNAELPRYGQVHVCAWIGYPTRGKADPSNAAPTVKAILDGLTDAGVWPDDDSTHVVAVEYRREATNAPRGTHTVRLTLTDQALPFGEVRTA